METNIERARKTKTPTQGDWSKGEDINRDGLIYLYCQIPGGAFKVIGYVKQDGIPKEEALANAAVMANSNKMLQAIKNYLKAVKNYDDLEAVTHDLQTAIKGL
jgi:DNA/RNA endonuclease G (NUC1)